MVVSLFLGVAWAQTATYYGTSDGSSGDGTATVSLDSSFVSAIIDTLYAKTVQADAFLTTEPPNQVLPLPVATDTTGIAKDSLNVIPDLFNRSNRGLSRIYNHVFGNGTAAVDSLWFAAQFIPMVDHPDSAAIMVKSSDRTKSSVLVAIRKRGLAATDTATIAYYAIPIAANDAWEYHAIPLLALFTKEEYTVEYLVTAAEATAIEVSPIKLIGRREN